MKSFGFRSLRARLAALILVTMVLVTGLILASYLNERSLILAQMEEDCIRLVTLIADDHEQLISRTRQFLLTLAKLPEIRSAESGQCPGFMTHLLDEYPRYTSLGILNPNGELLCGAGQGAPVESFAGEPWLLHALRSRDFSMGPLLSGVEGSSHFAIGYPILNAAGEIQSVVFTTVDLSQFGEIIAHLRPPGQLMIRMVSRKGRVLSCLPRQENCDASLPELNDLLAAMSKMQTGAIEIGDSRETLSLYAFAPLSSTVDTGLYVIISVPVSSLYSKANRLLAYQFAGIWVLTLFVLGLVWLGSSALIIRPVDAMVLTAERLSLGDMDARTGLPHQQGELGSLARALDNMAEALDDRAARVSEYETQLRSMASQLTHAEERERRRLAEGLHDRVGQLLGISKIKLGMLLQAASGKEVEMLAAEVRSHIVEALEETRSLTFEISPPILYEIGLEAALEYLAERLRERHGLPVTYTDDGQPKPIPESSRVLVYRAAHELLNNVLKHAKASEVVLKTELRHEGLLLSVEDDGIGFDAEAHSVAHRKGDGYGLFSIRERIRHAGGTFSIVSSPGRGCRVTLTLPVEAPARDMERQTA